MRTLLATAALLLVSSVAHAEYMAPAQSEVRKQPTRIAKVEKTQARKAVRAATAATVADTVVAEAPHSVDIDDVLAKVNGVYMTGVQRCYTKSRSVDPYMSSKVDLQFKISPEGRVISALHGAGMEKCLTNLMAGWQFGVALDEAGAPKEADFKISLILR